MTPDARPVCLVTGIVSDYRRKPFRVLAERQGVEVIAFEEAGPPLPGLTVHRTGQAGAGRLAGSGRYRAVICGLGGRLALPGSYLAARRAGIPFVLWATIWAHPRTPAHALSYLPTTRLYRDADAVVTYGPHVTRYVEEHRGGRGNVFEAPQAVDVEHFGAQVRPAEIDAVRGWAGVPEDGLLALFVGRLEQEKGVHVLLEAWRESGLRDRGVLAMAGEGPLREQVGRAGGGVLALGRMSPEHLPALYAAADFMVLPSVATATFKEPWGLVLNEGMLQRTPAIASDAVGAAAGGLVRDGRNGFVVPAGDSGALATRMRALAADPMLRERLGGVAREDAERLTPAAWADGVSSALDSVGAGR